MVDRILIPVERGKARLLAKLLEALTWPENDDGLSSVWFMRDNNLTVDEFVALENELDRLRRVLGEVEP